MDASQLLATRIANGSVQFSPSMIDTLGGDYLDYLLRHRYIAFIPEMTSKLGLLRLSYHAGIDEDAVEEAKRNPPMYYPALPANGDPLLPEHDARACILCLKREKRTVMVPCGHVYACITCSFNVKHTCMICREPLYGVTLCSKSQ